MWLAACHFLSPSCLCCVSIAANPYLSFKTHLKSSLSRKPASAAPKMELLWWVTQTTVTVGRRGERGKRSGTTRLWIAGCVLRTGSDLCNRICCAHNPLYQMPPSLRGKWGNWRTPDFPRATVGLVAELRLKSKLSEPKNSALNVCIAHWFLSVSVRTAFRFYRNGLFSCLSSGGQRSLGAGILPYLSSVSALRLA